MPSCTPFQVSPITAVVGRRGFTLIELLVVISIIALLIAILLPALGKAKLASQSVQCLSNQRQLFLGVEMYTQQYKEWMPIAGYNGTMPFKSSPTWARSVAYLLDLPFQYEQGTIDLAYNNTRMKQTYAPDNRKGIFKCPTENYTNNWKNLNSTSYGWNTSGYGLGMGDNYFLATAAATRDGYRRVMRTEIVKPSGTIVLGDYLARNGLYDYVNTQFTGAVDRFSTYHNGGANVLWNDGHATPLKYEYLTVAMRNRFQ